MIARALPVTSTTAVRTINTGVFIATSLLRGPRASQSDYRGSNEPTVNAARAAITSSAHQRFNLAGGLRCELAAVGYREISLDAPGLCRPTLPRSLFPAPFTRCAATVPAARKHMLMQFTKLGGLPQREKYH
jgi:hypothetical protein